MRKLSRILVTGGAGFIGSNLIRHLLAEQEFSGIIINVDKLTYAGNPDNLADIREAHGGLRYSFERADICDPQAMDRLFSRYDIDTVVHLAAESHVDRSISGPDDFIRTNVMGTFTLLETARRRWSGRRDRLFYHLSTDEVFGALGRTGMFSEGSPYDPRNPYSASKACSDHLVRAYLHTYGVPVIISNCSNNYGPYQFPEKLIPLAVLNLFAGRKVPVYGDGKQIRSWLYVEDHCRAIWKILSGGRTGETYLVGGEDGWENIAVVRSLCEKVARARSLPPGSLDHLVSFVADRPGHDRRYAVDCGKIGAELGWRSEVGLEEGLERTVRWYADHQDWIERINSGRYRVEAGNRGEEDGT